MLKIGDFLPSDGRSLQAWASGSHREKGLYGSSYSFPTSTEAAGVNSPQQICCVN